MDLEGFRSYRCGLQRELGPWRLLLPLETPLKPYITLTFNCCETTSDCLRLANSMTLHSRASPPLSPGNGNDRPPLVPAIQLEVFLAHQLRVLGSPEVLDGDGRLVPLSLGKPLALLIYVACNSTPVSRDDVADLLWPGAGRQKGRHSVRQALWVLRNAVGEDLFENHDPLSLKEGVLDLDQRQFTEALSEGRVEEARALWRGPFSDHFVLAGVRHWNHWTDELRGDLEHRFSKALLQYARFLTDRGEADEAVSTLDQAIEVAPSSEAPHLARIELLLDLLRLGAAREALADAHQVLGDNPGSAPRLALLEQRLEQTLLDQRDRIREGESFPLEFVGRSRELAGLHTLWRDADLGRTRVAVITGPSGIGKTRLAQELLCYLSGAEVRSVPLKGSRAEMKLRWGTASDFVRQLLRLPGSAGISSASDSLLRAMLPSMGREAINLQTVNGVSPAAILDAVSDLLEAITFETPLLVVVDDFQWMDQDSRTLFLGLANRSRELRVLFLILGRSDLSSRYWEEVESSLVEEAGARRFLLKPLIEEEVGELLALGAAFPRPEDAPGVVARIHQASGGNPLFIREILKDLQEKGVLHLEGPGWVFDTAEIPAEFQLPENIQLLLRERLDRLSEAAANLAATLAGENRRASSDTLQEKTQLPSGVFTQAVAELLDRGVIEWVDGDSLDFVHDVLRDTAMTHLAGSLPEPPPKVRWLSRNRVTLALAFGVLIALPLGVFWERGTLPWTIEPDPLPYGGGIIVFQNMENPPQAFRILDGPMEEWESVELNPAPPPGTRMVFRAPGGGYFWFGADDKETGPDLVQLLPDGTRIPLLHRPGDDSLLDLSPDGSRVLIASENVGQEPFSHSLFWAYREPGQTKHLIYKGSSTVGLGRWSEDGDMVAFNIGAASDSLAVYSLTGERLWARAFGEISDIQWCGGSILIMAAENGQDNLFRIDFPGEEVTAIAPMALVQGFACSPDGNAVVHIDVVEGRPAYVLRDLETGEVHPFPTGSLQYSTPHWIPDAVSSVPVEVRAQDDTLRIRWGDRRVLSATLINSDRSQSQDGLRWESLDPSVASVSPDRELTGNGAGVARILARWRHSLLDTVVVIVEDSGNGGPTLFHAERFEGLDTTRWIAFGSHPPLIRYLDGEGVLQILGDEKYSDGVIFKESIPLDQGFTAELEFKLEINRDVHQNLNLCLRDTDLAAFDRGNGVIQYDADLLCFLYPSRELDKRDPSDISFRVAPGGEIRVNLPDALPTSGWTHVAIQVRPDGEPSLVINRERVATSPILLPTTPSHQWTVVVEGDAVGTEVLVRNLNIWREVRY